MRVGFLLCALSSAVLFTLRPTLSQAGVFKCVNADGKTSYADAPCETGAQSEQVQADVGTSAVTSSTSLQVLGALYASPRNGKALDVTGQIRSMCLRAQGSCSVRCGNQLAGDPDFGQRKYCRVSYHCVGGKAQELRVPEGENLLLSCRTDAMAPNGAGSPQSTIPESQVRRSAPLPTSEPSVAMAPHAPHDAAAGDSDAELSRKTAQIARWIGDPDANQARNLREAAESLATQETLKLGAGLEDWGPANPKWLGVYRKVSSDLTALIAEVGKNQGSAATATVVNGIAKRLSSADVDTLSAFADSPIGKRYWTLSNQVALLLSQTPGQLSAGRLGTTPPPDPPSKEQVERWGRLIKVTPTARATFRMFMNGIGKPKDPSASAAIGIIWAATMVAHAEEFQKLSKEYEADVAAFENFDNSPAGQRMIDALAASTADSMSKFKEYAQAWNVQIAQLRPEWQQFYAATTGASGQSDGASSGSGAGSPKVTVVSDKVIAPQDVKSGIQSAVGLGDGGLFAAGLFDRGVPKYFKISKDGQTEWQVSALQAAPRERPQLVGSSGNGGYWVAGTAQTRDLSQQESTGLGWVERMTAVTYGYLRHVDLDGRISPPTAISQPGEVPYFFCGVEVDNGYVLAGWINSGPKYANQPVPWIEKIDRSGKQVWQRTMAEDQGQQIALYPGQENCAGLKSNRKSQVTWAVSVRVTAITPTGDAWVKAVSTPSLNHPATFVVQLDVDGNEVKRLRHDFAADAHLLSDDTGLTLVERTMPKPGAGYSADTSVAWISRFDVNLRELSSHRHASSDLNYSFDAAYRTRQGGTLIAGCAQGSNLLVYVNPQGRVSPAQKIGREGGMLQCSRMEFAAGKESGEVLLLAANDLWGFRILKTRFTD